MALNLTEDKLVFGAGTSTLMLAAWAITARFPALAPNLTTIVGGLTGVFGIFTGAHVTNNWVKGKGDASDTSDIDSPKTPFTEPSVEEH